MLKKYVGDFVKYGIAHAGVFGIFVIKANIEAGAQLFDSAAIGEAGDFKKIVEI